MVSWTEADWPNLIRGALDVLLVYYLIYRLLLLVRGTRAERMLLGLGIVLLVWGLSRAIPLPTLNWILGEFLTSVIIIVVILFQDDFRRALTKVGLIPGFGSDVPKAVELSIKEISQAAAELSSRRIGGLIVIRRDVGLEDYTEHTVQIDSLVTHQLLVSIFLPTSPLHDGAVIIEGDRIAAAGAVLPLSFNPSISSNYGTRHRAAIGLSERNDALIVVVSEETGTISLIRESRITKDLNEKTLYNALYRLTVFRHRKKSKKGSGQSAESTLSEKVGEEAQSVKDEDKSTVTQ